MRLRTTWASIGTILLCALSGTAARASDGTLEINQTCAVQTGCFPGDPAGFPVTIGAPGSYRLTSNLAVTGNVGAIDIQAARVRVDLGGFEISGPYGCTGNGSSMVCAGPQGGTGIIAFGQGAIVLNGSVRGFGGGGVALGSGRGESLRLEENGIYGFSGLVAIDVHADRNAAIGIQVTEGIVRDCLATHNGTIGIDAFASRVTDSVASFNGTAGIRSTQSSVVTDNVSRVNGTQGISATGGVVRNNAVELNVADGIVGNNGTVIVGNSSRLNSQAGIAALSAGAIIDNVAYLNTGTGIYMFPELGGPAPAYHGNVVRAGPATTAVVNGINLGGNSCNGAPTCP